MPTGSAGAPGVGVNGDTNWTGGGPAGGAGGTQNGGGYNGGPGGAGGITQKTWTLQNAPFKPGDTITIHVPSHGGGGGPSTDPGLPGATATAGADGQDGAASISWG